MEDIRWKKIVPIYLSEGGKQRHRFSTVQTIITQYDNQGSVFPTRYDSKLLFDKFSQLSVIVSVSAFILISFGIAYESSYRV
jgi:hypothetical protein